ncbi:MAG: hypothetical protein EAZ24_04225 [Burkholderiales bacterium]|nr:MAG: hypothetical protein EAZ21_09660 [Betaproteobacteria bacterium]TAG81597.1 MAG: hypothetical protein EAZ24_04225 [Burkholderiales bacterium]
MNDTDYYSILGVSPEAEDIVVSAAYRALAQRYHPDKNTGRDTQAKMKAINEAYAVLSDPVRRAEYDKSYQSASNKSFETQDDDDQSSAFVDAMKELDERWEVAKSIYPDIELFRARLNKFSTSLSFAFVTTLLVAKAFGRRRELSLQLEGQFLTKYFGSNEQIVDYARGLILSGRRDAAKALNRLVEVIGSPDDPQLFVDKIESDFDLHHARQATSKEDRNAARQRELKKIVKNFGYFDEATELARLSGFVVAEAGGGIFSSAKVAVSSQDGFAKEFADTKSFVRWVQSNLCEYI